LVVKRKKYNTFTVPFDTDFKIFDKGTE